MDNSSDLVWARMKYCPFWPSRIVQPPPLIGRVPANKQCVLFLGTKQFGLVDIDKIQSYTENRDKYMSKGKGAAFKEAVRKMDEFIIDPEKFESNVRSVEISDNIQIKTERDIESSLGIKIEPSYDVDANTSMPQKPRKINDWIQEKVKLIKKIVDLQEENQRVTLDLKQKCDTISALISEKQHSENQLSREMFVLSTKVKELNSEISTMKLDHENRKRDDKKTIAQLTRENRLLQSRIKDISSGVLQHSLIEEPNEPTDNVYEVEKLMKHEIREDGLYFKVRWAGYSANHDTWEKEKNLMCPKILEAYKRKMKMK